MTALFFVFLIASSDAYVRQKCPKRDLIQPCTCYRDLNNDHDVILPTSFLNCGTWPLGDERVSEILNLFLTDTTLSPLSSFYLYYTRLSRIPRQVPLFPLLNLQLSFTYNNITSIGRGAFRFSRTLQRLALREMQLSTIEPGAFQGAIHPSKSLKYE